MYSPFYTAEQKFLYPNRNPCNSVQDVVNHIKTLKLPVKKLRTMPLKDLMRYYFATTDSFMILEAIKQVTTKN